MTWRDKLFGWKNLARKDIKIGMKAKLIIEKPWTERAWVTGRLNQIFIVADTTDDTPDKSVSVNVPDFIDEEDENSSHICSDDYNNFVYQE